MSDLLPKQQLLLQSVARALSNFKKLGKNNYSAAKIRARINNLKETWAQCVEMQAALMTAYPAAMQMDIPYFKDHEFEQHEDLFQVTLDYMTECLEDLEPHPLSSTHLASPSYHCCSTADRSLSHLPPISIPPFSGKPEDWESFRDRFTSLIIQNKEVSAFARMHFLSSSLTGRALESIQTVPITADNFEIAWQILVSRYENKRRLIDVHVSALCSLPNVSRESAFELTELRDKANRAIASLQRLNRSSDEILSDIQVHLVTQKLDHATRKAWKLRGSDENKIPSYNDLDRFIAARARALEELTPLNPTKSARAATGKNSSVTAATATPISCPICRAAHFLNKCPQFMQASSSQRLELVKREKRCLNCLSSKHAVSACPSKYSCRTCQQKHHSMLHVDSVSPANVTVAIVSAAAASEPQSSSSSNTSDAHGAVALLAATSVSSRPSVLLATARVTVSSVTGRQVTARALIDQGSEITFISSRLERTLKLRRVRMPLSISAIGGVHAGVCRFAASINISPVNKTAPVLVTTAPILKSLTNYSPAVGQSPIHLDHLADLVPADSNLVSADPIDLIIGADLYGEIILEGVRKGTSGTPIAQNTIFGWVVSGPTPINSPPHRAFTVQQCSESASLSLEKELRRFWEIEEIPRRVVLSPDEQRCEDHFMATHSRGADGRYTVRLPFRHGPPIDIGNSRDVAERCLRRVLRQFKSNPELEREYSNFMREYEAQGHMQLAISAGSSQVVYIPHHPVIRESSTTTHLRVVFNASSLTSNARSLNDHLLPGPKLQTDLSAVIMRWRQFRYVYSADVAKMYRQIRVDPRDIDYQRILWFDRDAERIQEYQLLTVTYGTASAPFLALRVIRQLLRDEGHSNPLAVPVLTDNIYVDDVLFGADDIPLLRQIRDQVCSLLRRGQLDLRKWSSNSAALLTDIDESDHGLACGRDLHPDDKLKVLGICWIPSRDVFEFRVSCPLLGSVTKRSILSTIAKVFDPLGWSTPVTISAKVFMQRLWQLRVNWDEPLSAEFASQWQAIRSSLLAINGLQLSRWIARSSATIACELHGFSDASNHAYAAAIYTRVTALDGETTTMLVVGKARVAPVKSLSVPRLELAAAVMLSRLLEFVITALQLSDAPCYCWTDSTVVLAWLSQHPSKWKTFVSNRVSDIQTRIPFASWRHVSTIDNPADCASRGIPGQQLAHHPLWWHGPPWLKLAMSDWPTLVDPPETAMEQTVERHILLAQPVEPWDLASRFSSWPKLLRVTAYILRYTSRLRQPHALSVDHPESPQALAANEVHRARIFWLKTIQSELFPRELHALIHRSSLSAKSAILSLNPFLDEDKLIRVGGRLANAPVPTHQKHPILLASHPVVRLIVQNIHLRTLHAGIQLTLSTLRGEFWVVRARSVVRSVLHRCVSCARERAASPTQLMGNLPPVRVSPPARAFLHCGLDYAGPVAIRALSGRGIKSRKAYIAVFVCMATRAVHLELVDGYSTPAFLGAFSRFTARRGLPESMYSDNGTTFVGADREMTAAFRAALRDPAFLNKIASDHVAWHFMPPAAPHFGGLWEAGVKSVKYHLRRVVRAYTLTYEEFSTLLCNVEASLNSRPLAPLTDSLDDYEPLTPGHFLIGAPLNSRPEPSLLEVKENRLTRWQLVRQLHERFWKLWQTDYLNTLQQRAKWRRIRLPGIQIGQLVVLRNPLLPPCKWDLGRVSHCHPGLDGLTRVVTVKTALAEYKRPISQICILPIDIEQANPANKDQ